MLPERKFVCFAAAGAADEPLRPTGKALRRTPSFFPASCSRSDCRSRPCPLKEVSLLSVSACLFFVF